MPLQDLDDSIDKVPEKDVEDALRELENGNLDKALDILRIDREDVENGKEDFLRHVDNKVEHLEDFRKKYPCLFDCFGLEAMADLTEIGLLLFLLCFIRCRYLKKKDNDEDEYKGIR